MRSVRGRTPEPVVTCGMPPFVADQMPTRAPHHTNHRPTGRRFALVLAAALLAAPALPPLHSEYGRGMGQLEAQTPTLRGAVGHWTDTTVGPAAIVVNGERWSGKTSPADLRRLGVQLFGTSSDRFVQNGSAAEAFPFAVHTATTSFSSGTLRAQFNMLGGESDQVAGILFGLSPDGEYYAARYNTKEGNLAIWGFANGERRVMVRSTGKRQLPLRTWHTLQVTITGNVARVSLAADSTLSVSHTFDTAPTGRVGVWVKRDAITAFRSFDVLPQP